jgi:hypothetical protein
VIAPLRKSHGLAAASLAVVLPVVISAGLAARAERPTLDLPEPLRAKDSSLPVVLFDRADLWSGAPVRTLLATDEAGGFATRAAVRLTVEGAGDAPDLLVYWSANPAAAGVSEGVLLGAVAGGAPAWFPLPGAALHSGGRLTLYSLGHDEVIATAELPAAGGARR